MYDGANQQRSHYSLVGHVERSETKGMGSMATSQHWTRENIAWAAGLFEGEGWIGFKQPASATSLAKGGPHLEMRLGMTDEDVVRRFAEVASVGSVYGPYRKFAPDGHEIKTSWSFISSGKEAYALIIALLPWLHSRRQEQAMTAVRSWLDSTVRIRHLTADQVRSIRLELATLDPEQKRSGPRGKGMGRGSGPALGPTMASIGREYGVPASSIKKIRDGLTYKFVT